MENINTNITTKAALKEAANIVKGGYDHYNCVHALERAIMEAYCLQTGADLNNLKRSARAIRLNADITWRAVFYCSLISTIIGENISPQLFDKVSNDLIIVNSKGDFKRVADMEKIRVRGEEYAVLSKGFKYGEWYVIKMNDPYWYGCVHLYEYSPEVDVALETMHVPTCMVKGFQPLRKQILILLLFFISFLS